MKEKHFIALIFLVSLAIKLPLALSINSFGVDESLYLATAKHFVETGEFGIKTEFYDEKFISPLLPFIESVFYFVGGEKGALFISPIFSSLSVLVIYFLGKFIFDRKVGVIAAVIALFAPGLLILGTRPLTESVAIFFFSISILSMYLAFHNKNKISSLLFSIFAVLTFMTRFQYGGLLFVLFVFYLVVSKKYKNLLNTHFVVGIVFSLLVMSPWLVFNLQNYSSLIGGPAHQASSDLGFNIFAAYLYIPYLAVVIGTVLPFVLYGIYKSIKRKELFLLATFFIVFLTQFFIFGKVAEERYLLPLIPSASVLGSIGFISFYKKSKKFSNYLFVALILLNLVAGLYGINLFKNYPRYNETREAALFIKENCQSSVMSNSFTHVWYYTGFENIQYFEDEIKRENLVRDKNISCVFVSQYESPFRDILVNETAYESIFTLSKVTVYKVLG